MPEEENSVNVPKRDTSWPGVLLQLYTALGIIYGFYLIRSCYWSTIIYELALILLGFLGVTAGAHRLWSHGSYKADPSLRLFLMFCQTLNFNGSIYDWVLEHRIHHKFHGTDDDPSNFKRGWYYAHLGCRMVTENPRRAELVKEIDMSDIEQDRIVMFQKRFYWLLAVIFGVLIPINTPAEYWGESVYNCIMVVGAQRISILYHINYLIDSAKNIWGLYPGDRFFSESNWVYVIKKSYWHDYHYTVPWDYLTNEFGSYDCGITNIFIKICAVLGLAHSLRTIDSWGIRRALESSIESKKSIPECINAMEEVSRERLPEDFYLFDRTNWPKK